MLRGGISVHTIRAQSGSAVTVAEHMLIEGDVVSNGSFIGVNANVGAVRTSSITASDLGGILIKTAS